MPDTKKKPCPYCTAGSKPTKTGDHWLVRGLSSIRIVKCKASKQESR